MRVREAASLAETAPAGRRPLLALALVALGVGLLRSPAAAAALEFERADVRSGELWRLWTGHLVHATPRLALLDLGVLALLGAWWERRSRAALAWILLASALGGSLALLAFSSFERYTGSSALGSGLFVAAALELALGERGVRSKAGWLALALFAAKCALEGMGGPSALFVTLPAGTSVAASAHLGGGMGGALVVLARRRHARRAAQRSASRGPSHSLRPG